MSYLYYGVVLILFLALAVAGMKKMPVTSESELLGRYNNLRTFFAVEIIIGHCVKHFQTPLFLFENFLCISVAFFFFVSAYGMALSFEKKPDYLRGYLRSKCGYIVLMSLTAYIVSALIAVVSRTETEFYTGVSGIVKNYFIATNWYIWELIGFYILFYLIYRFVPKRRWLVISVVTVLAVVVMYSLHIFEPYYTSSLAFPFGILLGESNARLQKLLKNRYLLCGVIAAIVLVIGMCCFVTPAGNILRDVFLRNIMGIGVIMVLGFVLYSFKCDNAVLRWLKNYTTEIYIFQFIWLQVTAGYGLGFMLKLPVVLAATIITALIFHRPFLFLRKICTGKAA